MKRIKNILENLKQFFNNPIKLQIFKTYFHDKDIETAKERHKKEILMAIIYSKFSVTYFAMYDEPLYSMSGFLEKTGRLPNKNDKIRIIKGKYYFDVFSDYLISEIGFEIV